MAVLGLGVASDSAATARWLAKRRSAVDLTETWAANLALKSPRCGNSAPVAIEPISLSLATTTRDDLQIMRFMNRLG